jgi:cytochrome P450
LITTSVLVLSHHPEVQAKAQQELDGVLGASGPDAQLPNLKTRADLPYVEAVFKEIMRMYPNVPLGKYLLLIPDILNQLIFESSQV